MTSSNRFFFWILLLSTLAFGALIGRAQPFTGANTPGNGQDFSFTVAAGTTNIALTVAGNAASYSHLFLRKGSAPTATQFDFAAIANQQTNAINLQLPELSAGDYFLRVFTPASSATHNFSVTLVNNQTNLRSATRPATKPAVATTTGSLTLGSWHYFRVDLTSTLPGWRLDLSSATGLGPELYLQRGALPTTASFLRRAQGQTNDLVVLAENDLPVGTYYIGVYFAPGSSGNGSYTLQGQQVNFSQLTWDAGLSHTGSEVFTSPSTNGGDYFFRITTENTSVGAWRTALRVTSGEADVYLTNSVPPTPAAYQYRSARTGADGFVVPSTQFQAGTDWYLLVRAAPGSQWSLVSGEAFVQDLADVAPDGSSSSGPVDIGPEGYRFFRTTVAVEIPAWRLWLNGATNSVLVRRTIVPLLGAADFSQPRQMLLVPPYLTGGGTYYVSIPGDPGATINLDSREQAVTDVPFSSTAAVQIQGFGYSTYRVQIPVDQLSWQVTIIPTNGNPNVAVRRSLVPNEVNNDAYSEVAGLVADSVTLVPPALSDGTFYITVYATNAHDFTLVTGEPVVTDIGFTARVDNDDPNRVGWRYYRVADISQQLGALGWELLLQNYVPGTRIALRRNAVPSAWSFRNPNPGSFSQYDVISQSDVLQRPAHQADVWYIGVYNPTNALGNFRLVTRSITATPVTFDGGLETRAGVLAGRWQFFQFDVPPNVLGWDLRLTGVNSGSPQIVVRRDLLPVTLKSTNFNFTAPVTVTNWPSGTQWVASDDWSERDLSSDGNVDERGRTLTMATGRPLQPGTYYVGILNNETNTSVMSYTLQSRGIGDGFSIPVEEVGFTGGSALRSGLPPREPAFFRVVVPTNAPSWKVRLGVSEGDALIVVARDRLPNISAYTAGSATNAITPGRKITKLGNEHFLMLPLMGRTNVLAGTYYITVVAEGTVMTNQPNWIGSGTTSYTLQSIGNAPEISLGLLSGADIFRPDVLEGGESVIYHFQTLTGLLGFEILMNDTVGNPVALSYPTLLLPDPGASSRIVPADPYGNEGGVPGPHAASPGWITVADPYLDETIVVKARATGGRHPDGAYTLRVRPLTADPLAFDTGISSVSGQTETFRFFRVDVPPDALGWEVRLTDVQGGNPTLTICRDYLGVGDLTSPGFNPGADKDWFPGEQWVAGRDWTQRSFSPSGSVNEDGRILAMGMGRPLEPGTYYVSVRHPAPGGAVPISYTVRSSGIGDGYSIPVVDLPYAGGSATNTAISPRQAAYFRTVIPDGALSWRVKLTSTSGEMLLVSLTNCVPSVLTGRPPSAGRAMQKPGGENFLLLPNPGEFSLAPITNYLAVIGEGVNPTNTSRIGVGDGSFVINSLGDLPVKFLGTVTTNEIVEPGTLEAGETAAYQFAVPEETVSLQVQLANRVGNPTIVLRRGTALPGPGLGSLAGTVGAIGPESPIYGYEGGYTIVTGQGEANSSVITVANPTNGVYTLMVKARALANVYTNASYTLRIAAIQAKPLPADGGSLTATNQPAGLWQYYQVIIPPDTLGWDVRLLDVTSGTPKLIVRRDTIPFGTTTFPWGTPGNLTTWASSNQWAANLDWTRRPESSGGVNESGRLLTMGMGRPLEPGTYYVGVVSASGTNALSYRIYSRLIGAGYSVPVQDLAFAGGAITRSNLPAREVDYYRVTVPADIPGWKVKLTSLGGELLLISLSNSVPNVDTGRPGIFGKLGQKPGDEHYALLPVPGQLLQAGGTYYLAVVGEGLNPANANRVGAGDSSYRIESQGILPVVDLGVIGTAGVERSEALAGGELRAYQFSLAPGSLALQATLENRVGNPVMALRTGNRFPNPGMSSTLSSQPGSVSLDDYGHEGGDTINSLEGNANQLLLTLPNATNSTFRLVVKARASSPNTYPNSTYTLRVQASAVPPLNFGSDLNTNGASHTASGVLADNQRAYYRVDIPSLYNGQPVIGWRLDLSQTQGTAAVRVRKGALPADSISTGMGWITNCAVIAPDYLTNGTWYVEIRGSGATRYSITSRPVQPERPLWTMPAPGQPVTTPGLSAPFFGDTGVDTNGIPLPIDQGVDLEAGYYHFYAVQVGTNNGGVLRTELTAISGNPDLYIRNDKVPTLSHSAIGSASPPLVDRSMTSPVFTEYGNWVPLNGRTESVLKPGIWYIAVKASQTANARYRLRLSTGGVQDLTLNGGSVANQIVAGGDWRYYRVQLPDTAPANWTVTFSQQAGNIDLFVRDTVPPGNGASTLTTDFKDWNTDLKNNGPYPRLDVPGSYTFTLPPLRPGTAYYLGFRAVNDATFSVSSATSGASPTDLPSIAFYGGSATTNVPPNGQVSYRIYAPADARRWIHTSQHVSGLQVYIEQGTLPSKGTLDDFRSTAANSSLNRDLYTTFPWLADRTYFLTATNTTPDPQPFALQMDGRNAATDDYDRDNMPDIWELTYFNNSLAQPPTGDYDSDGVNNLSEYLDGTNPADRTSVFVRITLAATNGVAGVAPLAPSYPYGTVVTLTAIPNPGFEFSQWIGAVGGTTMPLTLTLTSNITVTAICRVPGDDFVQRRPITGWTNQVLGVSTGATKEGGESYHAGNNGGRSLWWTWTAPATGPATLTTEGSSFNTLLAVYTGTALSNLVPVASNDNATPTNAFSRVQFNAVAGTTYAIAVDGLFGVGGNIVLSVSTEQPLMIESVTLLSNGLIQINASGEAGRSYDIDVSTNLVNWVTLDTVPNSSGSFQYIDLQAGSEPVRFYRVVGR